MSIVADWAQGTIINGVTSAYSTFTKPNVTFSANVTSTISSFSYQGLFLLMGILIFPIGWDSPQIKDVCGNQATMYNPGDCSVRWSFILAIISVIDVFVLCILAFVLGSRYVKT